MRAESSAKCADDFSLNTLLSCLLPNHLETIERKFLVLFIFLICYLDETGSAAMSCLFLGFIVSEAL